MKRWPIVLGLIHIVLAGTLIVREEMTHWSDIPSRQRAEDLARVSQKYPESSNIGFGCGSIDLWPSLSVKAIYLNNLPLSLSFGYYQHPLSACDSPKFVGFVNEHTPVGRLKVATKVWLYNSIFVLLVGAQWWMIGRWAAAPNRKFIKAIVVVITIVAGLMTLAALLPEAWSKMSSPIWMWMILACTLSILILWTALVISSVVESVRLVRTRMQARAR